MAVCQRERENKASILGTRTRRGRRVVVRTSDNPINNVVCAYQPCLVFMLQINQSISLVSSDLKRCGVRSESRARRTRGHLVLGVQFPSHPQTEKRYDEDSRAHKIPYEGCCDDRIRCSRARKPDDNHNFESSKVDEFGDTKDNRHGMIGSEFKKISMGVIRQWRVRENEIST